MRRHNLLLATAILTVGLGFGHAGCYSSGTPGGLGAGGSTSQDNTGGTSGTRGADSGGVEDSGNDASNTIETCVDSRDCPDSGLCDTTLHRCVECVSDLDCTTSVQRCANNQCVDKTTCVSDKICLPKQICDTTKGYCVDCLDQRNCPDTKTCVDELCI